MFSTDKLEPRVQASFLVNDIKVITTESGDVKTVIEGQVKKQDGSILYASFIYNDKKHGNIDKNSQYVIEGIYTTKNTYSEKGKQYLNHYFNDVTVLSKI